MTDKISITRWIVSMGSGMWFAPWDADPGRTCVRSSAKLYRTEHKALRAIRRAKIWYPNRNSEGWRAELVVLEEKAPADQGREDT